MAEDTIQTLLEDRRGGYANESRLVVSVQQAQSANIATLQSAGAGLEFSLLRSQIEVLVELTSSVRKRHFGLGGAAVAEPTVKWVRKTTHQGTIVVFVHGILSNGVDCWTAANGTYWPKLLAEEPSMSEVDIIVFTYSTGITSGSYSVSDAADLLEEVVFRTEKLIGFKQIIFVCHSMGGLVVRRLVVAHAQKFIEAQTDVGVLLIASPSAGSPHARLLYAPMALMGHQQGKALSPSEQNSWLVDLERDFRDLVLSRRMQLSGKELIEARPVKIGFWFFKIRLWQKTVPARTGATFFENAVKIGGSDHFSIPKPTANTDDVHTVSLSFIESVIATRGIAVDFDVPPQGASFEWLATEIVNLEPWGATIELVGFTDGERAARIGRTHFAAKNIPECLENLGKLTNAPVRPYRVEKVSRGYRLIIQ